jgi:hypothetical protein
MNIIIRALRRITRQYKQSILLFLVLVILFLFYGSAWVIDIAANNLEKDIKQKIGAYVIVSKPGSTVESSSPLASFSSMRSLAQTMSLNYPVHYYDISLQEMVAPAKNESDILVLKGVEQCPGLPFFEGTIALVNGNALDENSDVNAAIISVEVAKRYDLALGDSFDLKLSLPDPIDRLSDYCFNVMVAGLFKVQPDVRLERMYPDYAENMNREIYVLNDFAYEHAFFRQSILQFEEESAVTGSQQTYEQWIENLSDINKRILESRLNYSALTFRLGTIEAVNPFKAELQHLIGNGEDEIIRVSTERYEKMALGFISLQNLARNVRVITLAAMVLGIPLVLWLTLRDRKREFGILRALGAKKRNICLQVLFETLLISSLAISLSLAGSYYLSQYYSQSYLQNVQGPSQHEAYFGISSVDMLEMKDIVSSYKIVLPTWMILSVFILGLAVSLLGSLLPLAYFTSLKLRRLLM